MRFYLIIILEFIISFHFNNSSYFRVFDFFFLNILHCFFSNREILFNYTLKIIVNFHFNNSNFFFKFFFKNFFF